MEYGDFKKVIKSKGLKLSDVAESIGYTYNGLMRGIKDNTLDYDARVKLSELLLIPLSEFQDDTYTSPIADLPVVNESNVNYNSSVLDVYKDQIKVLQEQIIVKDAQIEQLMKIIETLKK